MQHLRLTGKEIADYLGATLKTKEYKKALSPNIITDRRKYASLACSS